MNRDKRSILLLISVVSFFILAPLLEGRKVGGLLLLLSLYITLVAATSALLEKRTLFWIAIPMAIASMLLLLASHYYPTESWLLANSIVLTAFLILVSTSLFVYLGQAGQIAGDRLRVSVSLYFLLGLTWFALYNLINLLEPGSFAEGGKTLTGEIHWSKMLYFSLVTLTTLGYGDIVAIKPTAQMTATLEAAAGVLYIAITVARLVSAHTAPARHEE
jgi:hypothetical protein